MYPDSAVAAGWILTAFAMVQVPIFGGIALWKSKKQPKDAFRNVPKVFFFPSVLRVLRKSNFSLKLKEHNFFYLSRKIVLFSDEQVNF